MLLISLSASPARAATPEDGRRAYDSGRFNDAMGIWAELSRAGSAEAAFGLGLLYDLGNGTKEDPTAAFFWYKMAAEAGLPAAEFNVGAMYDGGRGVPQSAADAALWYAKAAARGHHRAQFDLAQLYEQGDGVPRNPDAAAAWFQAAATGGISAAARRLQTLKSQPRVSVAGELIGATLAAPTRDVNLTLTAQNPVVELVWIPPSEPQPVHYEVQVNELVGDTLHSVFTASVSETALTVQLPAATPDFYVWNVNTVGHDGSHAPSEWNWFSVGTPASSQRSVASAPGASRSAR